MPRKKTDAPAAVPEDKVTENSQAETPENAASVQPESPEGPREAGAEVQTVSEKDKPAETAPVGRTAVVRSPKGLNLREGPALSYEVLEVLPDGVEVTALDLPMGVEVPGWRLVSTAEKGGWVQSRFLRLEG